MWAIEENASKGRSCVCARPFTAPVIAFKAHRDNRGVTIEGGRCKWKRVNRGVSFCQVNKINVGNQLRVATVEGNHWNMGAIPAFVINAITMNIGDKTDQDVVQTAGEIKNKVEPVA